MGLIEGFAPEGTPADQSDSFPIYAHLLALGLSPADVRDTGDEIKARVAAEIVSKAIGDDAGERFKYLNDSEHRHRVNTEVVARVLLGMGFSTPELQRLQAGLQIDLGIAPEKHARTIKTGGPMGEHGMEILEDDGGRAVVRSLKDGGIHEVRPDLPVSDLPSKE